MLAARYGCLRLDSVKRKQKEGKTGLTDLIDSPNAKANGSRDEVTPSLGGREGN